MTKSVNRKLAQKEAAKKRPQTWKKGQSGNPAGAPKRGMSFKEAYEWAMSLNTEDMAAILSAGGDNVLAEAFRAMPKGIDLKSLLAARVLSSQMFEPQAAMLNHISDRTDGPVKEQQEHSGAITITVNYADAAAPASGTTEDQK